MNLWSMGRTGGDPKQHTQAQRTSMCRRRRSRTGGSSTSSAPTCALFDIASRAATAPCRSRSSRTSTRCASSWVKTPIDWVTARASLARPATASCSPRAARCSSRPPQQGRHRRSDAGQEGALPRTAASCPTASRCWRSRMRAAKWSSGTCRRMASATPTQLTTDGDGAALGRHALARRQVDRALRQGPAALGATTSRRRQQTAGSPSAATATSTT